MHHLSFNRRLTKNGIFYHTMLHEINFTISQQMYRDNETGFSHYVIYKKPVSCTADRPKTDSLCNNNNACCDDDLVEVAAEWSVRKITKLEPLTQLILFHAERIKLKLTFKHER